MEPMSRSDDPVWMPYEQMKLGRPRLGKLRIQLLTCTATRSRKLGGGAHLTWETYKGSLALQLPVSWRQTI